MVNIITNIEPTKKLNIKELITFISKLLNIDDFSISVSYDEKLCKRLSTENVEINAALDYNEKLKHFNLILKNNKKTTEIICHEMVHAKQYLFNELKLNKIDVDNYFLWKKTTFPASTPYEDRPWEAEALRLDNKLLKQYKKWKKEGD